MNKQKLKKLLIGDFKFSWQRLMRFLLLLYVALCIYGWFFAEGKIFLPHPSSYQDNADIIKLTTTDGVKISALYLPNPKAKYTILYSHGNASDLGDLGSVLYKLKSLGFAVLAYDYHGYGTSEGKPSEKNTYLDINSAYQYLTKTLNIPPQKIIIYGHSVGGGPSVDLASRHQIAGLILESTFITAFRVVTVIPIVPFDKFNNISKIKKVHSPILIMHGKADNVIPFWHGETLFSHANSPKLSLWSETAGHNDLIDVTGEKYERSLHEFINLL